MSQPGESSRTGAARRRKGVKAANRPRVQMKNFKVKNGSNRHPGRTASHLENHRLPDNWQDCKSKLDDNKQVHSWSVWKAMSSIVLGSLVISHANQRVPGLCHDVAMSFLCKLFKGEDFFLFTNLIAYSCSGGMRSAEAQNAELALLSGGYEGYTANSLFVLNGSHRFLTLFAFYVGFLTVDNLYGDGRRGTLVHPDACCPARFIYGWRFIYKADASDVPKHLKDLVNILIDQLGFMPSECHSLHPDVRHGYACVDELGSRFLPVREPAAGTELAAIDEDGIESGEEEEEAMDVDTEEEKEEVDYTPLKEIVPEEGMQVITHMMTNQQVIKPVFHAGAACSEVMTFLMRNAQLEIISFAKQSDNDPLTIDKARDFVFNNDTFAHPIHAVAGIMLKPLYQPLAWSIFKSGFVHSLSMTKIPSCMRFLNPKTTPSMHALAQYGTLMAIVTSTGLIESYPSVADALLTLHTIDTNAMALVAYVRTLDLEQNRLTMEDCPVIPGVLAAIESARVIHSATGMHEGLVKCTFLNLIEFMVTRAYDVRTNCVISDDRFVMTLALVMYGLLPIADFDNLTTNEAKRVRVLRALVLFFLEVPRKEPKGFMQTYVKTCDPPIKFTVHGTIYDLDVKQYTTLETMQEDSNAIFSQHRALFGLFDHFNALSNGEELLLEMTRTQVLECAQGGRATRTTRTDKGKGKAEPETEPEPEPEPEPIGDSDDERYVENLSKILGSFDKSKRMPPLN